mgnify:CR=1 FL=1
MVLARCLAFQAAQTMRLQNLLAAQSRADALEQAPELIERPGARDWHPTAEALLAQALGGADISMLIGLPVAGLFYYWVAGRADLAGEFAQIPKLDANLETEGVR